MKIIRIGLYSILTFIYAEAILPSNIQRPSSIAIFQPKDHDYEILSSETVYKRWRSIIQQTVKMSNGNVVNYDVSQSFFWIVSITS